jgi:hypothetical protein
MVRSMANTVVAMQIYRKMYSYNQRVHDIKPKLLLGDITTLSLLSPLALQVEDETIFYYTYKIRICVQSLLKM